MKLGLIGCGKVADFFHVPAIRTTSGVRIEAIADIDKDRVERFGRKHGIEKRYLDYHPMLDECDMDSVLVCTPPRTHAQIILDSVDRRLNVLCEKPFVSTVSELDTIVKSVDKNLTVFPVHNYLFTPSLWLAEHLMKNRDLGKLEEMNADLAVGFNTWRSATDYRTRDPAGVITDLLYHVIYVAHRLCGPITELANVETKKNNDHVAKSVLVEGKSRDGAHLRLSASWTALLPHFRILLRHSRSSIDMDLIWHPYRISVQGVKKENQPKPLKGRFTEIKSLMSMSHPSFRFLHQDFRNCVVSKSTPQVTIDQAKETLQTIQRITEKAGK
jgi:predicted dehydrogenase